MCGLCYANIFSPEALSASQCQWCGRKTDLFVSLDEIDSHKMITDLAWICRPCVAKKCDVIPPPPRSPISPYPPPGPPPSPFSLPSTLGTPQSPTSGLGLASPPPPPQTPPPGPRYSYPSTPPPRPSFSKTRASSGNQVPLYKKRH